MSDRYLISVVEYKFIIHRPQTGYRARAAAATAAAAETITITQSEIIMSYQ